MQNPQVDSLGTKRWYKNGKFHREDGPAIEWYDGDKEWYINGQLHREDGAANEWLNGDKRWWIKGQFLKSITLSKWAM